MLNPDNTNLASPTPFAEHPIPAIVTLWQTNPAKFLETKPELFEEYLKADVPLAERDTAFLHSQQYGFTRVGKFHCALYPAFYCINDRLFVRLETPSEFMDGDSQALIREQFSL